MTRFFTKTLLCICLILPLFSVARAQRPDPGDIPFAQVKAVASHRAIHAGEAFKVAILVTVRAGFHVNSHEPADEFLVPTDLEFDDAPGVSFELVSYPVPDLEQLAFSDKKVSVYHDTFSIMVSGRLAEDLEPGEIRLSGQLSYQACDDKMCFMPETVAFSTSLRVVASGEPTETVQEAVFAQETELSAGEKEAKQVIEKGLLYALGMFFVFGLALNLTPCVYPVIPMTVGFFGAQGDQGKGRTLWMASYYVVGIAVVFAALGLVSGLAGKQWGFLFQNPWFVIAISLLILAMAASMFGAFEITVPSFLMQLGGKSRQGAFGSFVMGLTVGVVIAPCAAGIVLGLVGVIAKLGMVVEGAILFFVMGLGLGLPYLFLAVFSGFMTRLPKSGMWMVWIRKFFGVLLIGVALYFLVPLGKHAYEPQYFYLAVLAIFGGLFLGFLDRSEGYTPRFRMVQAVFGCALMVGGGVLAHHALQPPPEGIRWVHSVDQFESPGKPLVIDFYADWCNACKELDRATFSDKRVIETAKGFVMARVDLTTPNATGTLLQKKFGVAGLPTVVFVGADGVERKELRVVGFVGPDKMVDRMKSTLAGQP